MWMPQSYQELAQRYPREVSQVMRKLRSSSSVQADADAESLTWGFSWSMRLESQTPFDDGIRSLLGGPSRSRPRTGVALPSWEEEEARILRNLRVLVEARRGRWSGSSDPISCPDAVVALYREQWTRRREDEARRAQMSPEEQRLETEAALQELRGFGGFMELRIPASPSQPQADFPEGNETDPVEEPLPAEEADAAQPPFRRRLPWIHPDLWEEPL